MFSAVVFCSPTQTQAPSLRPRKKSLRLNAPFPDSLRCRPSSTGTGKVFVNRGTCLVVDITDFLSHVTVFLSVLIYPIVDHLCLLMVEYCLKLFPYPNESEYRDLPPLMFQSLPLLPRVTQRSCFLQLAVWHDRTMPFKETENNAVTFGLISVNYLPRAL